mgnify:CR=1 FL=1
MAPRASYHHGDLAPALLEAAVELIAERGLPSLSLRECARRAGVSHAAPYRHFADKEALVLAIAQQGFEWLADAGERAMAELEDPRERLDAFGVAYVRFSVDHPVHHRVMFTSQFDPAAGHRSFALLVEATAALLDPGEDVELAAIAAWSLMHGLSMLLLDERIPARLVKRRKDVEALARGVLAQWRGPLSASPRSKSRRNR